MLLLWRVMMRCALALSLLFGCATTGGKLGAAGAVVFGLGAVASFDPCLNITITTTTDVSHDVRE